MAARMCAHTHLVYTQGHAGTCRDTQGHAGLCMGLDYYVVDPLWPQGTPFTCTEHSSTYVCPSVTHIHTYTHKYSHTHKNTHKQRHTQTLTNTLTNTHSHTHSHIHTHTHKHTLTHTITGEKSDGISTLQLYLHLPPLPPPPSPLLQACVHSTLPLQHYLTNTLATQP